MSGTVWIGLVVMEPIDSSNPVWVDAYGKAGGAVMTALALAEDAKAYQGAVAGAIGQLGARATEFEDVEPLEMRRSKTGLSSEVDDLLEQLQETGEPQIGTAHLFPAEDFASSAAWLEETAEDLGRTETQRVVIRELAKMLGGLDLPLLEGANLESSESGVTVHLAHASDNGIDLEIEVRDDDQVTVGYTLGHMHFAPLGQGDYLEDVYRFVYSALQGGVAVDVWEVDGRPDRVRASILRAGGDWEPLSVTASTPGPSFDEAPTRRVLLSFVGP